MEPLGAPKAPHLPRAQPAPGVEREGGACGFQAAKLPVGCRVRPVSGSGMCWSKAELAPRCSRLSIPPQNNLWSGMRGTPASPQGAEKEDKAELQRLCWFCRYRGRKSPSSASTCKRQTAPLAIAAKRPEPASRHLPPPARGEHRLDHLTYLENTEQSFCAFLKDTLQNFPGKYTSKS